MKGKIMVKRNLSVITLSGLLILIVTLFCGCSEENNSNPTNEIIINIGVLLGETGLGANNAIETKAALDIAVKDINSYFASLKSGQKYVVKLNYEDTGSDTLQCLEKARKLANQGIKVIIGVYTSAEVKFIKPFLDSAKVLLITPSAVAASLAIPNDNIFRFASSDTYQADAIVSMLKHDNVQVLVPIVYDNLWGNDLINAVSQKFTSQGGTIINPIKYTPDGTSKVVLLNAISQNAQNIPQGQKGAFYMISYGDGTDILNSVAQLSSIPLINWYGASAYALNPTIFDSNYPNADDFAYSRNFKCPIFAFDTTVKNIYDPVNQQITNKIGFQPDVYAFIAYDALWVTALAYSSTGIITDLTLIKNAVDTKANGYLGTSGHILLDDNGDRIPYEYNFWGLVDNQGVYNWKITGIYNCSSGLITIP